jgi:hypothetical protein
MKMGNDDHSTPTKISKIEERLANLDSFLTQTVDGKEVGLSRQHVDPPIIVDPDFRVESDFKPGGLNYIDDTMLYIEDSNRCGISILASNYSGKIHFG